MTAWTNGIDRKGRSLNLPDSFLRVSTALAAADFCAAVIFLAVGFGVVNLVNMSVSVINVASATDVGGVVTAARPPVGDGGDADPAADSGDADPSDDGDADSDRADDVDACSDGDVDLDGNVDGGDATDPDDVEPCDAGVEILRSRVGGAVNWSVPCAGVGGGDGASCTGSAPAVDDAEWWRNSADGKMRAVAAVATCGLPRLSKRRRTTSCGWSPMSATPIRSTKAVNAS